MIVIKNYTTLGNGAQIKMISDKLREKKLDAE